VIRTACALAALVLTAALGAAGASASRSASTATATAPVKAMKASGFGTVMATLGNRALYYWTPEKRRPGTIVCTGACARAWPVLFVRKGVTVRKRYPGFKGVFGTIRRPDGRRQLTYNRLPLYTYAHEAPRQVLCDDVDGWFVIRL
jgi:predicted lipoprotein with Yx(FWY)xxD motif